MKNQQPLLIGNQEYNNLNVYKLRTSDRSPNYFLNKLKYINDCLNRNEVDKASDIISKEVDSLVNEYAKVRPHILIQIGNQGDGYNGTTRFHAIPLSSGNMNKIDLNYKSSVVELDGLGYALGYKQSVTTEKGVGLWYNSNNKVQQVTKEQFKEILDATNEFNQEGYNMNLNFHNMKSSIK
ncbi:hypothetical protein RZE82_07915 [Mollicutes bacterium LVI A0039]|nr:hypothetical protein RZE82_07915 [Mollicutes bacterium LVI A0039]